MLRTIGIPAQGRPRLHQGGSAIGPGTYERAQATTTTAGSRCRSPRRGLAAVRPDAELAVRRSRLPLHAKLRAGSGVCDGSRAQPKQRLWRWLRRRWRGRHEGPTHQGDGQKQTRRTGIQRGAPGPRRHESEEAIQSARSSGRCSRSSRLPPSGPAPHALRRRRRLHAAADPRTLDARDLRRVRATARRPRLGPWPRRDAGGVPTPARRRRGARRSPGAIALARMTIDVVRAAYCGGGAGRRRGRGGHAATPKQCCSELRDADVAEAATARSVPARPVMTRWRWP